MEPSAWEQISRDQTESYWALTELPGSQYKITNEYRKKQAEYRGRRIQEGIDVECKQPDDPTADERALLEYYDLYEKETVSLGGRKYGPLDKTLKEVYKVTGLPYDISANHMEIDVDTFEHGVGIQIKCDTIKIGKNVRIGYNVKINNEQK